MCFQVEVFSTGRSLAQRSPHECGVSELDNEGSILRRPWPPRGCRTIKKNLLTFFRGI